MNFIEKWIRRIVREEIEKREQEHKVNAIDELRRGVELGMKTAPMTPPSFPRKDA